MKIGKWYDPISERWFVPREAVSFSDNSSAAQPPSPERVVEIHRKAEAQRTEAQRIWQLLVESCAHR
ncbi:hypothetical protein [Bradyrhizobium sp. CB3481]|uniref:hypothetical protein n=1 Tax=Bradyrhizobium sp. CB3481 TaxID=3039158 RepID=UPI0024B1D65D|nr:hypothetical protein [Bradyrhizobium sp. CB3481]WFU15867.1 hypothetical protein QA643_33695 [Bradyrhizobium sp. CB3481]